MRYIYLIGFFIFLWALLKYLFIDVQLSVGFISFELLSFLFILGLVYLSSLVIRKSIELHNTFKDEFKSEKALFQGEIDILNKELKRLKNQELNKRSLQTNMEVLTGQILELIIEKASLPTMTERLIKLLKRQFEIGAAIGYVFNPKSQLFDVHTRFGIEDECVIEPIKIGEGIHGQAMADNQPILMKDIPEEYIDVQSGSGKSKPRFIYLLPLVLNNDNRLIIEVATFKNEAIDLIWKEVIIQMVKE